MEAETFSATSAFNEERNSFRRSHAALASREQPVPLTSPPHHNPISMSTALAPAFPTWPTTGTSNHLQTGLS